MAAIARFVHVVSEFQFGAVDEIAGDLSIRFRNETPAPNTNGDHDQYEPFYEPKALWFRDADGETHVYPLSDQARQALITALTGGIIVAEPGDLARGGN